MSEEKFVCPKCGTFVSKDNNFCKKCGASLAEVFKVETGAPPTPPPQEVVGEKPYERRFSLFQRFLKVLFLPSEGMKDIALAPDYGGALAVLILNIVLVSIGLALVFQKLQLVGPLASSIWGFVVGIITLALVIAFGLLVVRWLIKSLIVKAVCDSGSGWDFKTVASVTGYAYLADVAVDALGLAVLWFFVPSIIIDTANPEVTRQAIANFQEQVGWIKFWYTLPISLLGLAWKSYLGGLGTRFGTKGKCSLRLGFIVFFCLGLISVVVSMFYPW